MNQETWWSLKAGKGKEMDSALEPPERNAVGQSTLFLSNGRGPGGSAEAHVAPLGLGLEPAHTITCTSAAKAGHLAVSQVQGRGNTPVVRRGKGMDAGR